MALKKLRMICAGGDKTLAEWDTETVSQQRLAEIEREFNEKVAQGWFAADISEKRNVLIREFDPNAEILLIPKVQGGRYQTAGLSREEERSLWRRAFRKIFPCSG